MRLLGIERMAAWRMLNDTEVLRKCLPGCEAITELGEGSYQVSLSTAVGPVRARIAGRMAIEDAEPPRAYRLRFQGQSSQAGVVRGDELPGVLTAN
jgi:carbon monoxide dehydrogenase subunit G